MKVLGKQLFFSCNKDSGVAIKDTYIASPEKLMSMAGKDWSAVKPQLDNKKSYWYTGLTESQSLAVNAAISLPAIEESNNAINYNLLLNTSRQTNKVVTIDLTTADSLNTLDKSEAYKLMLTYYNNGLKTLTDTSLTLGNYASPDGTQITTHCRYSF